MEPKQYHRSNNERREDVTQLSNFEKETLVIDTADVSKIWWWLEERMFFLCRELTDITTLAGGSWDVAYFG